MQGENCLRGFENGERGCGTTKVKQTAATSGDMLVMAGTEAEGVTDFIIAATEALRRGEALEAAHTSDAAFDAAMILLDSPIANDKSGPAHWLGSLASRSGSLRRHR